jgi:hypothetical protein
MAMCLPYHQKFVFDRCLFSTGKRQSDTNRFMKRTRTVAVAVLLLESMTMMSARAATITVTNTNDSGPGSLRQALANTNNGDTINFAVTGVITLSNGGLGVTKNVTISGPGAHQLTVNGNQALFAFGVFPQITVSISGLSIRNAQVGVYNNQGTVSVSNCVLSGHSSAGLYNHAGASMTVANSNISNNSGTGADNQGTLTVSSCVLSGNSNAGIGNRAPSSGAASLTALRTAPLAATQLQRAAAASMVLLRS